MKGYGSVVLRPNRFIPRGWLTPRADFQPRWHLCAKWKNVTPLGKWDPKGKLGVSPVHAQAGALGQSTNRTPPRPGAGDCIYLLRLRLTAHLMWGREEVLWTLLCWEALWLTLAFACTWFTNTSAQITGPVLCGAGLRAVTFLFPECWVDLKLVLDADVQLCLQVSPWGVGQVRLGHISSSLPPTVSWMLALWLGI